MNIKPEQLQNYLSKQIASIYFAFGAEILLVEQSLSMIKEVARQDGFNERFRFDIDGNFSWDNIISLISSPSLFAEKRILECRLTSGKIGVKGLKPNIPWLYFIFGIVRGTNVMRSYIVTHLTTLPMFQRIKIK